MAKGNMLLGQSRGKVGDLVFYVQNGTQMTRSRRRVIHNPRTSGQQIQRMIQATIAYAYAGLKTIVDHSFEGVQYGGKSMHYFMKRNMDALRAQVVNLSNGGDGNARFAIPNVRVLYPNEYIVSNGSLQPFVTPDAVRETERGSALRFPIEFEGFDTLTVGDFLQRFGLSAGDQLTFLILNVDKNNSDVVSTVNGESAKSIALAVRRWKLKDVIGENQLTSPVANANIIDWSVTDEDLAFNVINGATEDSKVLGVSIDTDIFRTSRRTIGGCCIHSRKMGNVWQRSPQNMWVAWSEDLTPSGFSLSTAYNEWIEGSTQVGVSEYILNGKPNSDVWPNIDDENP